MSLSFAHRRFRPHLLPSLLAVLLVPCLASLGFWQLRRADEKRALIEQYHRGATSTLDLNAASLRSLPLLQTVIAHGRFDSSHQVLLDNMPSERGAARRSVSGFHVLTPFVIDGGHIVLVDRGWLPLGASRTQLPNVDVNDQARSVRGRLANLPQAGLHLPSPNETSWPKLMNFPTYDELHALFGDKLFRNIILLDPAESDGLKRSWDSRYGFGEFGPKRHIGYAVQWFGLAVTLTILYLLSQLRKPSNDQPQ